MGNLFVKIFPVLQLALIMVLSLEAACSKVDGKSAGALNSEGTGQTPGEGLNKTSTAAKVGSGLEIPKDMVGRWYSIEEKKWVTLTKDKLVRGPAAEDIFELVGSSDGRFTFEPRSPAGCENCDPAKDAIKLTSLDGAMAQLTFQDNGEVVQNIIRYGIDNASLKGKLVKMGGGGLGLNGLGLNAPSQSSGSYDINLQNPYDPSGVSVASISGDGTFQISDVKSGIYDLTVKEKDAAAPLYTIKGVAVDGAADDIGIVTISSTDYSFKTEFLPQSDFLFDGVSYKAKLRVKNVGTVTVKGVNYQLSTSEPSVVLGDKKVGILNTIDPGQSVEVEVSFAISGMEFVEKKLVTIDVALGDVTGKKWNDRSYIDIYKVPVQLSVGTLTSVSGVVIFKDRKIIPFSSTKENSPTVVSVPYVKNYPYKIMLSAATRAQEAVYSIGLKAPSASVQTLSGFFDTASFEPNDLESQATKINLFDSIISYLHVGDLDGYTFTFSPIEISYDGGSFASANIPVDSGKYIPGQPVAILGTPTELSRLGFVFRGWNTSATGAGNQHWASDSILAPWTNVDLHAQWSGCGNGEGCYSKVSLLKNGTWATTPSGKALTLANGVWVERGNGSHVLASDGSDNWAYQLNPDGRNYVDQFLDKSQVVGRVCPMNVFVPGNMAATGKCLYYDAGNTAQRLDAPNNDNVTDQNIAGSYRLGWWTNSAGGNGAGASWYEGNIQSCAAKGMRLPTLFEAAVSDPGANKPTDASPAFNAADGVPSIVGSPTWTASGYSSNYINKYWTWDHSSSSDTYNLDSIISVRCVSPAEAAPFKLTYDPNGGTGFVPVDSRRYAANKSIVVNGDNGLTRTGFIFNGWNTAIDGSGTTYYAGQPLSVTTGDLIIYANWLPTYTVTYVGNGSTSGAVPMDVSRYLRGAALNVSGNTGMLAKYGYAFAGWTTTADGSGTPHGAGDVLTIGADNLVLYPKWIPTYAVTYVGAGSTAGAVPTDANRYLNGSSAIVLGNTGTLAKDGYTFSGWTTTADGSGAAYSVGRTLTVGTGDITLYAKWLPTYAVTYVESDSTAGVVPIDGIRYLSGATATIVGNAGNLVKDGYAFAGWTTEADGSGAGYTAGQTLTVGTGDITLYAKWLPTYVVTYVGTGSTSGAVPMDGNRYLSGASATILGNIGALASGSEYFAGWTTAADGSGAAYGAGESLTIGAANLTLYAKWSNITCGDSSANNCYSGINSDNLKASVTLTTPSGKALQFINGIWIERGFGTRVLASDGSDNWAAQLTSDGRSYSNSFLNKSNVSGRVCPKSVFIPGNLVATGRCLYFDSGNLGQRLDAPYNDGVINQTTPGSYRLGAWNNSTARYGNFTGSSWYEGNIQTCADKGMRLPTLYETSGSDPIFYTPNAPSPWFSGTNGVPSVAGFSTWTSSSYTYDSTSYWAWAGTSSNANSYYAGYAVRCVVP